MNIYDKIYTTDRYYNAKASTKIKRVLDWADKRKTILDVGCGRGHYLKELRKRGFKVTGLEPSVINLSISDVINDDILGVEGHWDSLYCMDVLEHIEPEQIEETVAKLVLLADSALIGIANHSDKWQGVQLHLIRQNADWWQELLSKYYSDVKCTHKSKNYYIFECLA